MTTPDLQILLLGPPEIRWKGELFSIQRRIPRSMLFYLAAKGGMVTRNELVLLFWEDQSPEQARTRLRETLSRLRQMLPVADLVVTSNDLVGLDFTRVFVDQVEFDQLINKFGQLPWKIPLNDPLPAEIQRNLIAAGRLWRGSRYLAGADLPSSYELDNWLTFTSQYYEQLYRRVFERLSSHAQATGNFEQAIHYTKQALERDYLDESLHARIIELMIADGKIEQAHGYFRQVETTFSQQFGVQPGDQFLQISKRLNLPTPDTNIGQTLPWSARQSLDAPFIGRQQTLAKLWHYYQKKNSIFLSGEIGIGKTRLLQEFFKRQKITSLLIASRCTAGGESSPFQSTIDSERRYGTIRKHFHSIPAVYAKQMLQLFPELAELRPELAEVDTQNIPVQQLSFEAIRYYLLSLTREQSVIFLIEDIQWLDIPTLEALDYVIQRDPFGKRAMLILSGRSDECQPITKKKIRAWQTSGYIQMIELERFGPGDVYNLAGVVLPELPSQDLAEKLATETGGNPYFILETLREALENTPRLSISRALPLPLPLQLAMIIRSRLDGLSPAARQFLDAAAIMGTAFNPEVLQITLEMDRQNFEQSLAELETGGIIEARQENNLEICYHFIHTIFREILLADLSSLYKQKLHRQVAGALIAIYGEKISRSILAYHHQQAGNRVLAFDYMLEAALEAFRANQIQKADEFFTQAANLIDRNESSLPPETLYRFYRSWLNALLLQNNLDKYQQVSADMLNIGQEYCSSLLIGTALNGQAILHLHQQALEQGLADIRQALPYLEQVNNSFEYLTAHNTRGTLLYMLGKTDEAMQMYQRALVVAESMEKPPRDVVIARAYTHEQVATIYQICGWPVRSLQHAQNALADAIETENLLGQASAYGYLTFACFHLAEYAQARMYNDFGLRLAQQTAYKRMVGYHHIYRSWIELINGNLTACYKNAISAYDIGEQTGEPLMMALSERSIADICHALAQPVSALQHYQRALSFLPQGIATEDISWRVAFTWTHLGQIEQASTELQRVIKFAQKTGSDFVKYEAQICYAWLLFRQGDYENALQLGEMVRGEAEKRSLPKQQITMELLLGEIARQKHDLEKARGYFETVAEKSALLNYPWQEIRARIFLARLHNEQGWSSSPQDQRITFLLDQIEHSITENCQLADGHTLRDFFSSYRSNLSTLQL